MRLKGFKTVGARIVNRGKKRKTVTIRFRLSEAARLLFLVQGPGPSCRMAARIPVSARAGLNRVRFDGTVRNRRLAPGTYRLTIRLRGTRENLARTFVRVVVPGSPIRTGVKPRCSQPTSSTGQPALFAFVDLDDDVLPPTLAAPEGVTEEKGATPAAEDVLGAEIPETAGLPRLDAIDAPNGGDGPGTLEIVLLATVAAAFFGLGVAYMAGRQSRRPWF